MALHRRRSTGLIACLFVPLLLQGHVRAGGACEIGRAAEDEKGERKPLSPIAAQDPASLSSVDTATREALERGLEYLARRQAETADGSFPRGSKEETREWAPVGVTALGSLAYMAAGNSPGRGPYGEQVEQAVDYLLERCSLSPEAKHPGYIWSRGDSISRTHGHGYATLALAEAYGMSPRSERMKRSLAAAIDLIVRSQGAEGGWHYDPFVSANHEGSVTITYVQALRAAHNSGIQVPVEVISRAEDYVIRLQKPDGTFRYQLDDERSSVALTAAAVATLNMAGHYDDRIAQSGIDAIWSKLSDRELSGAPSRWRFYERLYVAQAFWQLSDRSHFERWFAQERARILREQSIDGSWRNSQHGDCYATAMNCLVLALPEGLLPIFQR